MVTTRPDRRLDSRNDWKRYRKDGGNLSLAEFWSVRGPKVEQRNSYGSNRATRRLRRYPRGDGGLGRTGYSPQEMERLRCERRIARKKTMEAAGV